MFLRELTESIDHIRGAGPAAVRLLAQAGIEGVGALLCHYPRDWEDRSRLVPLKDFNRAPVCTVAKVLAHDWFGAGAMRTLKIHVEDDSARAVLVCFNRPFLERQLKVGGSYRLWGKFYYKYGDIQSTAFEIEPVKPGATDLGPAAGLGSGGTAGCSAGEPSGVAIGPAGNFGRILPIYPLSAGLTQGMLRRLIKQGLDQYGKVLEDEVPEELLKQKGLLSKAAALKAIHFPASLGLLVQARKTLIYEELFYLEIMVGKRALERRSAPIKRSHVLGAAFSPLQRRLIERLPFELTPGQLEAAAEINRDMEGPYPMARLLQGDVGSGKTLVSFLAALRAIDEPDQAGQAGCLPARHEPVRHETRYGQAAIMAPTELLARQHAENAARLLEPLGIRPAFLTGNLKAAGRSQLLAALAAGEIDVVVGTHALFSKDVIYRNLRLVVVDEQHRFGVTQRQAVMAKGSRPDLLMMSATPIPRTLALTVFGDLDVSVIRDLPPGRKPVKTHLAKESGEGRVYDFVRKELAAGRQAYFVYPLIEAGEGKDLKDAKSMAARLAREVFPRYTTALIHSKIDDEEKQLIMSRFRAGEIHILAATSVVEVGVDVPNASCMVIEHAERFGLSALHQLRGRVGRGTDQAYCFLVYSDTADSEEEDRPSLTEDGKLRLKAMLENSDGFVIAEEDLKLRGPGRITGVEQSGYLRLGIADPVRDAEELAQARIDAFAILEKDPGLLEPEHRRIAEVLEKAPPFSAVTM